MGQAIDEGNEAPTPVISTVTADAARRADWCRWAICGLLVETTAINSTHRPMVDVLEPLLPSDLCWLESQYADVVSLLPTAYAIGGTATGKFVGYVPDLSGRYTQIFAMVGCAFLIVRIMRHLLSPLFEATRAGRYSILATEIIA